LAPLNSTLGSMAKRTFDRGRSHIQAFTMRSIAMPWRTASMPVCTGSRYIPAAQRITHECGGRSFPEPRGFFGEARTQSQFVESAATQPQAATIMVCSGGGKSGALKSVAAVACRDREEAGALLEPNLAFNRTCHGRRLWPGTGHIVHFPAPGQSRLPRHAG
jgi:hypothetical protein